MNSLQPKKPNFVRDRAARTDPAAPSMPRGSPLHEQKAPSKMDLKAHVLAATDAIARHQQKETHEAANPEDDDGCVTTECQTKNWKGKRVAKTLPDASASSASQSATDRAGANQRPARAAATSTGAAKARATSTRNFVQQRAMQPPKPAQPVVYEPASSTSSGAAVCASVPTGLKSLAAHRGAAHQDNVRPAAGVARAAQMFAPALSPSVQADERPITASIGCPPGVTLPTQIPDDVVAFITNVRQWVLQWNSAGVYAKRHLHYVEYCTSEHGTTWFFAAEFVSFLRVARNLGKVDAVVSHKFFKENRDSTAKTLRDNVPGAGRVKVGVGAGKGGNNGGKYGMWFVDLNHKFANMI